MGCKNLGKERDARKHGRAVRYHTDKVARKLAEEAYRKLARACTMALLGIIVI